MRSGILSDQPGLGMTVINTLKSRGLLHLRKLFRLLITKKLLIFSSWGKKRSEAIIFIGIYLFLLKAHLFFSFHSARRENHVLLLDSDVSGVDRSIPLKTPPLPLVAPLWHSAGNSIRLNVVRNFADEAVKGHLVQKKLDVLLVLANF